MAPGRGAGSPAQSASTGGTGEWKARSRRGGLSSCRSPRARASRPRRVSPGRGPRVSRARKSIGFCVL
eukprot:8204629-Alexandrium_andersonii.AAC.1